MCVETLLNSTKSAPPSIKDMGTEAIKAAWESSNPAKFIDMVHRILGGVIFVMVLYTIANSTVLVLVEVVKLWRRM